MGRLHVVTGVLVGVADATEELKGLVNTLMEGSEVL